MSTAANEPDDDVELVPIPLDRATRARLVRVAEFVGAPPTKIAGSMLRDILLDDELAHAGIHPDEPPRRPPGTRLN